MSEFSRIITLLRKEKRITQKTGRRAAGCFAGALSHYEKRHPRMRAGLVVRVADFLRRLLATYLLGRSPTATV